MQQQNGGSFRYRNLHCGERLAHRLPQQHLRHLPWPPILLNRLKIACYTGSSQTIYTDLSVKKEDGLFPIKQCDSPNSNIWETLSGNVTVLLIQLYTLAMMHLFLHLAFYFESGGILQ